MRLTKNRIELKEEKTSKIENMRRLIDLRLSGPDPSIQRLSHIWTSFIIYFFFKTHQIRRDVVASHLKFSD